ncbi:MAG TPA: hypothetical protein VEA37_07575, partial [Flavobacterium sp.]|nr:hypothetical protein [Flavobacterium sp.]
MVSGFVAYNLDAHRSVNKARAEIEARLVAEAGLEKAIWSLNQNSAYTGEVASPYGEGEVTIAIQNISSTAKSVTATGYIPSAASPRATKTLKATITIDTSVVSFNYGVQAGNGGFFMGNNSSISGSVYANGPIDGTSGNTITGDVYSAGPTGSIRDVNVSGNVHAHTLTNCSVGKDAFYQV